MAIQWLSWDISLETLILWRLQESWDTFRQVAANGTHINAAMDKLEERYTIIGAMLSDTITQE